MSVNAVAFHLNERMRRRFGPTDSGIISRILGRSEDRVAVAVFAVGVAPVVGWVSMALIWTTVPTEEHGKIDYAVLLAGGLIAALALAAFARWQELKPLAMVPWLIAAFATTFLLALGAVWVLYAGPLSLDFPKNFN